MNDLKLLTDAALIEQLQRFAGAERQGHVTLLRYLGELDERRLYLGLGYSSMWDYCRRALKFSESVSQQRIIVARAAREFPLVLTMIEDARLTLCTAADLAPNLNETNAEQMLAAAAGKTRREVQTLTAEAGRKPVERDVIRRVGNVNVEMASPALALVEAATEATSTQALGNDRVAPTAAPSEAARHRISFTASAAVVAKLEKLQELMQDASLEEVVDKASALLLEKVDPARRQARRAERKAKEATPSPKTALKNRKAVNPSPRRPGSALHDSVIVSAGRQCEFVSADGVRCTETRFLSIDHVRPYALGGTSTEQSNLRCLCMAHNLYLGRRSFGEVRKDCRPGA